MNALRFVVADVVSVQADDEVATGRSVPQYGPRRRFQAGYSRLLALQGARNIRTSAKYIADLQEDWEEHGKEALQGYREKFPDRYLENYTMLARVIRLEAER